VEALMLSGSVAKALENMREVVWDKAPVRCGWVPKADETGAPRFLPGVNYLERRAVGR